MRTRPGLFLFVLLIVNLSACATTRRDTARWVILPTAYEVSIGQSMAESIGQQYKSLNDAKITAYVRSLGAQVASVCDRKDIEYHFGVVEDPQVNAFAAPGGYVYVTTGLLRAAENEAEVVMVLGHEVGHIVARHSAQRIQTQYGLQLAAQAAKLDRRSALMQNVVGLGMNLALQGYSRENEYEADHLGAVYTCRLGYDPKAAVTFFAKLIRLQKAEPSVMEIWFSSHPATGSRIDEFVKTRGELPCTTGKTNAAQYLSAVAALKK